MRAIPRRRALALLFTVLIGFTTTPALASASTSTTTVVGSTSAPTHAVVPIVQAASAIPDVAADRAASEALTSLPPVAPAQTAPDAARDADDVLLRATGTVHAGDGTPRAAFETAPAQRRDAASVLLSDTDGSAEAVTATDPAAPLALDTAGAGIGASTTTAAPISPSTRAALHAQLDNLALARSAAWLALLHVSAEGPESHVRSSWFFAAGEAGRSDAARELHATLDALLDDTVIEPRRETARCVFPARRRFLADHLGAVFTDATPVADTGCDRRRRWMAGLAADALWLVFPAGYLNSPSSMFGHTLLRLDSVESTRRGPLLAYAANFVAETTESNGLVFAVKGLAGGYRGAYGVLPYYEKVKEYVRMESRDLWEYPLELDADERQRLLDHLWELKGAKFAYYFLSKNCAYQVLALLQTLKPEQDLLRGFSWWAIPTDTVRRLDAHGWLGSPRFRPALATRLAARAEQAGAESLALAHDLAGGDAGVDDPALAALPDAQARARTLDLAHDLVYLRFQAGYARAPLLARDRAILGARATLRTGSGFTDPVAPATPPHAGHASERVDFGVLVDAHDRDGGSTRLAIRHRFAWHDLLDDPAGYVPGSAITFGELSLSHRLGSSTLRVQEFTMLEIFSAAARTAVRSPISWRAVLGARRGPEFGAPLRGHIEGAPGIAYGEGRWLAWAYLPASLELGGQADDGYAVRAGGQLGGTFAFSPRLRGRVDGLWQQGLLGDDRARGAATLGVQTDLSRDWSLRVEAGGERLGGTAAARAGVWALRYF